MDPDAQVDPQGEIPPYRQLAGIIAARIVRGDWAPRRPIASETRMMQEYGVARATARKTVALLVEHGVVYVVPQRGTYVTPREGH